MTLEDGTAIDETDGYRLNLCPPPWEKDWTGFRHCDAVVQQLQFALEQDGLPWKLDERETGGTRWTNWICPEAEQCWLCLETRIADGALELVQVSLPELDNKWSFRLASAVFE
jgi:hypothetical protein